MSQNTEAFPRRDGHLFVEDVAVSDIVGSTGTPVYLYSATALENAHDALAQAFAGTPHVVCYAIKANMNLAVVSTLVKRGAGVDVTSGGELFRALRAGASASKIVYSGVGKRDDEIRRGTRGRHQDVQRRERVPSCAASTPWRRASWRGARPSPSA